MINNLKLQNYVQQTISNSLKSYIGSSYKDLHLIKKNVENLVDNIANTLNVPKFKVDVEQDELDKSVMHIAVSLPISHPINYIHVHSLDLNVLISQKNYKTHTWEVAKMNEVAHQNICKVCGMQSITYEYNRDELIYTAADLSCNDYILREVLQ